MFAGQQGIMSVLNSEYEKHGAFTTFEDLELRFGIRVNYAVCKTTADLSEPARISSASFGPMPISHI